jgi:2,3-bisphosphoglycerate-independent phosphoglycerate mutase
VLEALGIGVELKDEDVAARGNFCTVDAEGKISDRRAGRIPTEKNQELCRLLSGIKVAGVDLVVAPVKEHRFVLLLRGKKLSGELMDSDPQHVGMAPLPVKAVSSSAETTARLVNEFVAQAKEILKPCHPANMLLLRGFSQLPRWPLMRDVYKLNPAAIASYPMYRGLARLVGMKVIATGGTLAEEMATLRQHYSEHDFFFLHVKQTDSRGEDGDFQAKVKAIEEIDTYLPELLSLKPDVLLVTGDHSTPAILASHSWHPVPFMLRSRWCRPDQVKEFNESACAQGAMGRFPAAEIMTLALANALKLDKFGA